MKTGSWVELPHAISLAPPGLASNIHGCRRGLISGPALRLPWFSQKGQCSFRVAR
jgi:hypothetical protein